MVEELVESGLDRREARWLVEEFGPAPERVTLAARRRLDGEPLQYVVGHWPFRGLDLDVDSRVLIPRPESEGLVDVALAEVTRSGVAAPVIVDLGTGSGAIGLALLDELTSRGVAASLVATDESEEALEVARANARKHGLSAVTFVRSSWFDDLDVALRGRVDLVVANPPYVDVEELAHLDPVLRFEPLGALVAPARDGVAGFADLSIILTEARAWLAPRGALVLEHGDAHRDAVLELATRVGYSSYEDLDDLARRPRVLVARR